MPDSTEVVGSMTLNTGVHRSEVPVMSLPQSGSNTATAPTSPDNANTANLILVALLKVTQGQDVLLQHLQATRPPQPPQQSLQATQPVQPQQQTLATQAPQQDSSFLPGSIHSALTAPAQPTFILVRINTNLVL